MRAGWSLRTQPCVAQSPADGPCSSLRAGVRQLAARTSVTDFAGSYTVFDALLDELGFTEDFVQNLNATAVLIPSDAAFAEFFGEFPEAVVDPLKYVKLNSDVFKQVWTGARHPGARSQASPATPCEHPPASVLALCVGTNTTLHSQAHHRFPFTHMCRHVVHCADSRALTQCAAAEDVVVQGRRHLQRHRQQQASCPQLAPACTQTCTC